MLNELPSSLKTTVPPITEVLIIQIIVTVMIIMSGRRLGAGIVLLVMLSICFIYSYNESDIL